MDFRRGHELGGDGFEFAGRNDSSGVESALNSRLLRDFETQTAYKYHVMKTRIENAELITNIFGNWPSFHDAEIHTILITRDCVSGPCMDATIHHWHSTSEVDSKGYLISKNHTLSTIRFSGVTDLQMRDFNHQNVLWDLEITELANPGEGFAVSMPPSYGCEATFKCKTIRVISAIPHLKS
jgi:hypothetical protein